MRSHQYYPSNLPSHYPSNHHSDDQEYPQEASRYQTQSIEMGECNALLTMATPLITLITQIRHTVDHHNVGAFRAQVVEEIKTFEKKLTGVDYPVRTIVAARYCLCTAIDEAILSRSWGAQSVWVQGSLLSLFHKETWGGERFYIILENMVRDVRKSIDFVELSYFLLSLGFEGKFHGVENRAAREEIRNRIFYHIRHARNKPERILSRSWKNSQLPKTTSEKKTKLRKFGLSTVMILVVVGGILNYKLYCVAKPTVQKLENIATVSPITSFSQLIRRQIISRNVI